MNTLQRLSSCWTKTMTKPDLCHNIKTRVLHLKRWCIPWQYINLNTLQDHHASQTNEFHDMSCILCKTKAVLSHKIIACVVGLRIWK